MMLLEPILLLTLCFCGLGLAAPNGQSPRPETTAPPTGPHAFVPKELVRRGRPLLAAREPYERDLVKRQRCPVLWETCGTTCCLMGQECYTDSYGKIGCKDMPARYSDFISSLQSSMTVYNVPSQSIAEIISAYHTSTTRATSAPPVTYTAPQRTTTPPAPTETEDPTPTLGEESASDAPTITPTLVPAKKDKPKTGLIAGATVGGIVGLIIVAVVIFIVRKKMAGGENPTPPQPPATPQPVLDPRPHAPPYPYNVHGVEPKPPVVYPYQPTPDGPAEMIGDTKHPIPVPDSREQSASRYGHVSGQWPRHDDIASGYSYASGHDENSSAFEVAASPVPPR